MNDDANTAADGEGKPKREPKTPDEQKKDSAIALDRAFKRYFQHHTLGEVKVPLVDAFLKQHGMLGLEALRELGAALQDPLGTNKSDDDGPPSHPAHHP